MWMFVFIYIFCAKLLIKNELGDDDPPWTDKQRKGYLKITTTAANTIKKCKQNKWTKEWNNVWNIICILLHALRCVSEYVWMFISSVNSYLFVYVYVFMSTQTDHIDVFFSLSPYEFQYFFCLYVWTGQDVNEQHEMKTRNAPKNAAVILHRWRKRREKKTVTATPILKREREWNSPQNMRTCAKGTINRLSRSQMKTKI